MIDEQKAEISELICNQMLPRSPSPTPPETTDFSMQTLQEMECQTISLDDHSTQTEVFYLSLDYATYKTRVESNHF